VCAWVVRRRIWFAGLSDRFFGDIIPHAVCGTVDDTACSIERRDELRSRPLQQGGGALPSMPKAATDDRVLGKRRWHLANREHVLDAALSHIRHRYRAVIRVLLAR